MRPLPWLDGVGMVDDLALLPTVLYILPTAALEIIYGLRQLALCVWSLIPLQTTHQLHL